MKIRKMNSRDAKEVYELGSNVKGFEVSDKSRFWQEDMLQAWANENDDILLIAEENEKIIGFLICQSHLPTRTAVLHNLWISESSRKKGLAKDLLDECYSRLKDKGISYMSGIINTNNLQAQNFFEKQGFHKGFEFFWVEKSL